MLSALAWVPCRAVKSCPQAYEPSPEEIEELVESEAGEDEEEDEDSGEGHGEEQEAEECHATGASADLADELADLNMDAYDQEDDRALNLFGGNGRRLGGAYYKSNSEDPYLAENDEEDEEEVDDLTIRPSDLVLLAARNEDDVSFLELWVCEKPEGEDTDFNMYVHHDVMLPAFPLCMAWMDFNVKATQSADAAATAAASSSSAALASVPSSSGSSIGNFVAVGSMNPEIEIWDLDTLDEVEPAATLGGFTEAPQKEKGKKKKKGGMARKAGGGKTPSRPLKLGSHCGAVMALSWNKEFRNVLASGGEDQCVKVWDMATLSCQHTLCHHTGKVQSVVWCPHTPSLLLSGSFDKTVVLADCRAPTGECPRWQVSADVEAAVWDPHSEHRFLVSSEDGIVCGFDSRVHPPDASAASSSSSTMSSSKALFKLSAHDKATCTMSFNVEAPHLLATGSTDKRVKLWDLSGDSPKNLASTNPKAGAVFSVSFCADLPSVLAIGGSKGTVQLWDTSSVKGVSQLASTV